MTGYIISILLTVIISVFIHKVISKKDIYKIEDPFDGPIQRQSKAFHEADNFDMNLAHETYKEREKIKTRVINIKKKK